MKVQVSETESPAPSGVSVGKSVQIDANVGACPSYGGSVQVDANGVAGVSSGVGRYGGGLGAQTSIGSAYSITVASPALFPSEPETNKCATTGQ